MSSPASDPDRAALARFLGRDALRSVERIGDGHSNPTYLIDDELVVRRPPPPPLPPSAHDVLREARVLAALHGRIPVPRVLATCADESVIGAPFYVMEKMDGWVVAESVPPALDGERRRMTEQLVDTLADLHAVGIAEAGLEDFGRPAGFLERQLSRFRRSWEHNKTRELPAVEQLGDWLARHRPQSPPATIVHGDYRLGNVMFGPAAPARLVAVFDWEMATLGDPLSDLGYLVAFWVQPDDPPLRMFELQNAMRGGGFPTREELVARYEERTRRAVPDIRWYEVLALWKLAVVMEGLYRQALAGQMSDPYLAGFGPGVVELLERATEKVSSH